MKVSIIVPVYNNSKHLRTCLNSLVEQTLKDIEIICVDDASTDNSLEILKQYQSKYSNIKIIQNKINRGPGASRNIGIEAAGGEYIGFVDADDYVNINMYEELYEGAKELGNPEIVYTGISFVQDDRFRNYNAPRYRKGYAGTPLTRKSMLMDISPSMCNKIVRRDFLGDTRFLENVMWEDAALSFILHLKANSFADVNNHNYYYRKSSTEGYSSKNNKYNPDIFDIFTVIKEINRQAKISKRDKFYYDELRLLSFALAFQRISEAMGWKPKNNEEKAEIIKIRKQLYKRTYDELGSIEGVDTSYLSALADMKVIDNYKKICNTKKKKQMKRVINTSAVVLTLASGYLVTRKMVSEIKKKRH